MGFSDSPTLRTLLERRFNRRRLLAGGVELAALGVVAPSAYGQTGGPSGLSFPRVQPSKADSVIVPDGYRADVVIRWGDALFADSPAFDAAAIAQGALLSAEAPAAQARQFGYNCDGIGLFALDASRLLLCVNHEFPLPVLMFAGWLEARNARAIGSFVRERPSIVAYMQASVGLSVVELTRSARWGYVRESRYNRRITADTALEITGPARDHGLLNPRRERVPLAFGTLGNCAAGTTPWRTYLTAEENVDDYFGNGAAADLDEATERVHRRFGLRQRDSAYRWEYADPRFDVAANPAELCKFGWIVELDPFDPSSRPKKRTALGRFKHEGATTALAADGRAVVYMGDDQEFEYFYKFVSRRRFDATRPEANRDLLDDGTLYVARLDDEGRGEWLPLVHGAHPELTPERGFASQADVVLRCREAADRLRSDAARPAGRRRRESAHRSCLPVVHAELGTRPRRGARRGAHARHADRRGEPARPEHLRPHSRAHRTGRGRRRNGVSLGGFPARRRSEPARRRDVRESRQPRFGRRRQPMDRHRRQSAWRQQRRLLRLSDGRRGARPCAPVHERAGRRGGQRLRIHGRRSRVVPYAAASRRSRFRDPSAKPLA
jgi:secreted PhoX family phosphatase